MFLKLLKYDLKSIYKPILILDIVMVLLSTLTVLTAKNFSPNNNIIFIGTVMFLIIATLVSALATVSIYIFNIFRSYAIGIYGKDGYLLNTLPVTAKQIVLSKISSAFIMGIVTLFFGLLCIPIVFTLMSTDIVYIINRLNNNIQNLNLFLFAVMFIIMFIISAIYTIVKIYALISISSIAKFEKFKFAVGIVIYILTQLVERVFLSLFISYITLDNLAIQNISLYFLSYLAFYLIVGFIWYYICVYLIDKKLYVQ